MQVGDFCRLKKDLAADDSRPPEFWRVLQAAANTNAVVVGKKDGLVKIHSVLGADWEVPESWLEKV